MTGSITNNLFSGYWESPLARNTLWVFLGQGLRLFIQAGYFIVMARSLGPQQYGAFVAVTALVAVAAPFVGIGTDRLLIKNVAMDRSSVSECFGNGIVMTLASGMISAGLILALSRHVLPGSIPLTVVVMISFSDLICYRLVALVAGAFQAFELMAQSAKLNVLVTGMRFLGIGALALTHHSSAASWAFVYAGTTIVAMIVAFISVRKIVHGFAYSPAKIREGMAEGFAFATGQASQSVYNDIDKTMLARLSTPNANGIYAAAYRLIEVAFIPVGSLLYAAYPGFFRHGERNIHGTFRYAKGLMLKPVVFSTAACFGLLIGAPIVPKILGPSYASTVEAVRWLACLPLLKSIHYFLADSLTGAGYQGWRMLIQLIVAGFNVVVNLWIIRAYSWRGAAWSSIASDGLLVALLWLAIVLLRREQEESMGTVVPVGVTTGEML
ncbi:MAG: hypothetical protein JWN63_738 [Candidatus Acidoferrum typicum]|nr:hypothetical protein [Candidatus Acidoferrum typicum]